MVDSAKKEWADISQKIENEQEIMALIEKGQKRAQSREEILVILKKARESKGLDLEEAAALLYIKDEDLHQQTQVAAGCVKNSIYGNRVVMFAPLYLANHCVNHYRYCGYSIKNERDDA